MNFSSAFLSIGFLAAAISGVASTRAQAAFFDLQGAQGADVKGAITGSTTLGGITPTLTANSGTLNQTTNRFGVNAVGSDDDADTLDGGELAESITITFNVDIMLQQIQLSVLSAGEEASITIAGGTAMSLMDTGSGDDEFNYSSGNVVLTSESIVLSWISGNGFSFDDFTVFGLEGDFDGDGDRDGTDFLVWQRELGDAANLAVWEDNFGKPPSLASAVVVPEPASLMAALVAALGLLIVYRGRR